MIPLILKINNFLSYGNQTQTINFAPYKLICLSGKNGHGKSALLDALTWVIWGQARKVSTTSKPDQGLVHLGQVEMMVSLDFIFNNQKYRIKRDFSQKYGKPHTHVEFGMLDSTTDKFISLTDKTIRKTEEKIISTIGLDYDTFINTCFLRQGQSNEFSKKSAKERKEILTTILGLNHYDTTRKFILESMRDTQQKIAQHDHIQERITKEVEALDQQLLQENEIITAIQEIEQQQNDLETFKNSCTVFKETLIQKEEFYKLQCNQHQDYQQKKQVLQQSLYQQISTWRKNHAQRLASAIITPTEKKELEEQVAILQKELHTHLTAKDQVLQIKFVIQQIETALSMELQQKKDVLSKANSELDGKQSLLEKQLRDSKESTILKEKELAVVTAQLKELLIKLPSYYLLQDMNEITKTFERHKALYRSWIERANKCKQEMTENHHKQELSNDPDNPSCPLCEQNLSQARKRFLQKKLHDMQQFLSLRFHRLKDAITTLKEYVQKEHTYIQLLQEHATLTQQQHTLSQELEALIKQEDVYCSEMKIIKNTLKENALSFEQLLATHHTKIKEDKELQRLYQKEQEFTKNTHLYDKTLETYNHLQKKLSAVISTANDHSPESLYEHQQECKRTIMQLKKERTLINQELLKTKEATAELHKIEQEKIEQEKKIAQILTQLNVLTQKKQELLEKKTLITHAHQQKKVLLAEKTKIDEDKKILTITYLEEQSLAQAFSKDGIQALLIEEALPELEYEANDLLARLTDNQAHISIESLRDLKKGGTRETLDINISDNQGIRPYELFSGGEAFRIDFALRIAISKLLARRAGTSLQTLIIDEGFGSQDDEGLQRIMDALYTIQDDFEKIIIVSHLSAMKEQFPVHFIVNKQPQGSVVSVFEND